MHTCNISSRTTCRRGTVVQQQDLPAAAAAAAAEACSTNKQICGLSCALLGTRWNQHPHFFVVLSSATKQNNKCNKKI